MKTYTFADIKRFLETAPVDDVGMWIPTDGPHILYGSVVLGIHIYNSKRECNIHIKYRGEDFIVEKLYFMDNGNVSLIRVNKKGVADYDNQYVVNINTNIDNSNPDFIKHCGIGYFWSACAMADLLNFFAELGSRV